MWNDDADETDFGPAKEVTVRRFTLDLVEGTSGCDSWTSEGAQCTVGSHASNDLRLEDRLVSRFHFEIRVDPGGPWLRDLQSRNGTTIDGVEVQEAKLKDGSLIRLGRSALLFRARTADIPLPLSQRDHFGLLAGTSVPMRAAFHTMEKAAGTDATVLIEGETGTGKDLAAESIHARSKRGDGPFIVVDCGSIPANLIESELFGHERGAFTGAVAPRVGAFEAASRGTIFLDEIGELPTDLQPKLLRVLEQRTIQRLGSTDRRAIDVRVVAATNRDLRKEVNEGRFRSDLYYRLAVVTVRMPPLRQRPEDIEQLVTAMLSSLGAGDTVREELLSPESLTRLQTASWPGNVRELRNYLERSVVLEQAPPLEAGAEALEVDRAPTPDPRLTYQVARRRALDHFERTYLEALLDHHGGNVSEAARQADIHRVYLHQLLRRHGLRS